MPKDEPTITCTSCGDGEHFVCKGQAWTIEGLPAVCRCWFGGHEGAA